MKKLMVGYTLIMGLVGWYGMAAQASDLEENGYRGCYVAHEAVEEEDNYHAFDEEMYSPEYMDAYKGTVYEV